MLQPSGHQGATYVVHRSRARDSGSMSLSRVAHTAVTDALRDGITALTDDVHHAVTAAGTRTGSAMLSTKP